MTVTCWQLLNLGLLLLLQNLEDERLVLSETVPGEKQTRCWQLRTRSLGMKIVLYASLLKA